MSVCISILLCMKNAYFRKFDYLCLNFTLNYLLFVVNISDVVVNK